MIFVICIHIPDPFLLTYLHGTQRVHEPGFVWERSLRPDPPDSIQTTEGWVRVVRNPFSFGAQGGCPFCTNLALLHLLATGLVPIVALAETDTKLSRFQGRKLQDCLQKTVVNMLLRHRLPSVCRLATTFDIRQEASSRHLSHLDGLVPSLYLSQVSLLFSF